MAKSDWEKVKSHHKLPGGFYLGATLRDKNLEMVEQIKGFVDKRTYVLYASK